MATRSTGVGWRLRRAWLLLAIVAGVGLSCDGPVSQQPIRTAPAASREHAIEQTPVRSSALRSLGYDHEQRVLEIEFTNGAVYQYFDVSVEVYRGLMAAESHGRYFHQHVRDKSYRYDQLKVCRRVGRASRLNCLLDRAFRRYTGGIGTAVGVANPAVKRPGRMPVGISNRPPVPPWPTRRKDWRSMTEEEAKREVVAALRELHVILTQGPTRKYRTGLLAAHPQLPKLKEKIARALNPHKATLDPFPREFEMFLRHILYSIREVPADPVSVLQLEHQIKRFGGKPPSFVKPKKGATFDPKSDTLTLNGKTLSLTGGEKHVLRILVEKRAASFTELQTAHARPDRVLKALRQKYPGLKKFISLPGGPGRGGYSTTIELSDTG